MSEFQTKPNPAHPDRCPSIDPHDGLQCARRIHDDDQCQYDGIGWKKGSPRYVSDARVEAFLGDNDEACEAAIDDRMADSVDFSHGWDDALAIVRAALTTPAAQPAGPREGEAS